MIAYPGDIILNSGQRAYLRDALADQFGDTDMIRTLAEDAGMRPAMIKFGNPALVIWADVLREAARSGRTAAILRAASRYAPDHPVISSALRGSLPSVQGADIRTQVEWRADGAQKEVLMAERSTMLPICFLREGAVAARSVCRVVVLTPTGELDSTATGFLIGSDRLITNHHVLPTAQAAVGSLAQFDYELDHAGVAMPVSEYHLRPDLFFMADQDMDWAVVGVDHEVELKFGSLTLRPARAQHGDLVSIVQHPGGNYKQVAISHNAVAHSDEKVLQYMSDTLPGSSGAPVFDQNWSVLAVHHSGGWMRDQEDKTARLRNEGIACEAIIGDMKSRGIHDA